MEHEPRVQRKRDAGERHSTCLQEEGWGLITLFYTLLHHLHLLAMCRYKPHDNLKKNKLTWKDFYCKRKKISLSLLEHPSGFGVWKEVTPSPPWVCRVSGPGAPA